MLSPCLQPQCCPPFQASDLSNDIYVTCCIGTLGGRWGRHSPGWCFMRRIRFDTVNFSVKSLCPADHLRLKSQRNLPCGVCPCGAQPLKLFQAFDCEHALLGSLRTFTTLERVSFLLPALACSRQNCWRCIPMSVGQSGQPFEKPFWAEISERHIFSYTYVSYVKQDCSS